MKGLFISFAFFAVMVLICARAYTGAVGDNLNFGDFLYCFSDLPFDVADDWAGFARVIEEARELVSALGNFNWGSGNIFERIAAFVELIARLLTTPIKFVVAVVEFVLHFAINFQTLCQRLFSFFFGFKPTTS